MRTLADLRGRKIVVFDLEIKASIDGKTVKWTDYDKMGISVGCLYSFETADTYVYMDDNLSAMADQLEAADQVVGFNIKGFDIPLLEATLGRKLKLKNIYDLLEEIRASTGQRLPKGCKLDNVLEATFGMCKTEDGAEAPLMYQRGEIGRLTTYNVADVRRERMCYEYAYCFGFLKTPMHGEHKMANALDRLPTIPI